MGLYMGFLSFGVQIDATSIQGDTALSLVANYLPLAWFLVFSYIVWYAYKFCKNRISDEIWSHRTMIFKLAFSFGMIAMIAAVSLSLGDSVSDSSQGIVATVNAGSAFFYGSFFVGIIGLIHYQVFYQSLVGIPAKLKNTLQNALTETFIEDFLAGMKMYVTLAFSMGLLGVTSSLLIADTVRDRILMLTASPLHLGNFGVAMMTVSMGGSAATPYASSEGHISLMNWYWANGSIAPFYVFCALLIVPIFIFFRTKSFLNRRSAKNESDLLGSALLITLGSL